MPGPAWLDDDPAEAPVIAGNCVALLADMIGEADRRTLPTLATACTWHRRIYQGCRPPVAAYVGHFRGDVREPQLVGYEVGVGLPTGDGLREKVGVWSAELPAALAAFERGVHQAFAVLDAQLPPGSRPSTVDELEVVVRLVAEVHGEWVRIHPFVNGNGRTARVWAAYVALRYGLPPFVQLRPRPGDVAYARGAKRSMGRPPGFAGDHSEAVVVFANLLTLSLLP